MARYGQYETESRISEAGGVATYALRGDSESTKSKVIKAFVPAAGVADSALLKKAADAFVRSAKVQQGVAEKSDSWVKVHEIGEAEGLPYVVTDRAAISVAELVSAAEALGARDLGVLVNGIVRGLLDLRVHGGRSHGNLKLESVLLSDPKPAQAKILLADPEPDVVGGQETKDLRGLCCIIQSLVLRKPVLIRDGIAELPAWSALGSRGEAWRDFCVYLMGGATGTEPVRLADVAGKIPLPPSRARPVWLVAGGVAAIVLVTAIVFFVTHRKSTVAAEAWKPYLAATWFHDPVKPGEEAGLRMGPKIPAAVHDGEDPLVKLGVQWDEVVSHQADYAPTAILGKAVSNVEIFDGDANAQERFDKAFNQAVGIEYSLGKVYQNLDVLDKFFVGAKDAPEDPAAHWGGVQKLIERLKGPAYVVEDVAVKQGEKSLADYYQETKPVGVKPMRPQDRAKVAEWFEKIVYMGQIRGPWQAIASATAVVPPEEAFRQFVLREIKDRETDAVDVKLVADKLAHYVTLQETLYAKVTPLVERVDWDRWKSTYRNAGRVTDETEILDWAENIGGFEFLKLDSRDNEKLATARQSARNSAQARDDLRIYDAAASKEYDLPLARENEWLNSWSDSRIRDEDDRVVLVRDRITFNPWFDNQIKIHEGTLGSLERRVTDTLKQRIARRDAALQKISARGAEWKSGNKLAQLCYESLAHKFGFAAAVADPGPVISQKVTTEYDASTKYFETLDAAYNKITGQLNRISVAEELAGSEPWRVALNGAIKQDRKAGFDQVQETIRAVDDLPVLNEEAFAAAVKKCEEYTASAKALADRVAVIDRLADNFYLPDESEPTSGTTIRTVQGQIKPFLADAPFAAAVAPVESEIELLIRITDSKSGAELSAAAGNLGSPHKPVSQLALWTRLDTPTVATAELVAREPELCTVILPDSFAKVSSADRREQLLTRLNTDRVHRGYKRVEDRMAAGADDATFNESLRIAQQFKLGLPEAEPIRLDQLKPGAGTLSPKSMGNLMLYSMKQFCENPAAPKIEEVRQSFEQDLAALNASAPNATLADIRDAISKVQTESVSMLTPHGPELAGWTKTEKPNDIWEYSLEGKPTLVFKSLLDGDHRRFCLCVTTTPLSVVKSLSTLNLGQEIEKARIQDLADQPGPRVWRWDTNKHWFDRADIWITNQSGVESHYAVPFRGAKLDEIAAVNGGNPNEDHPMQYISVELATYLAARMGCRLPSVEEWQVAYALQKTEPSTVPNLRSKTWRAEYDWASKADNHPSIPSMLTTTWGNFENPALAANPEETLVATQDNGILWFSKVDRITDDPNSDARHTFHHLVGNVAQMVVSKEAKARLDQLAPINATLGRPDPSQVHATDVTALALIRGGQQNVFVVGGSSIGPVHPSSPPEKPLAVPRTADKVGWSDVGFRLAFTAEDPLPTKIWDLLRRKGYLK